MKTDAPDEPKLIKKPNPTIDPNKLEIKPEVNTDNTNFEPKENLPVDEANLKADTANYSWVDKLTKSGNNPVTVISHKGNIYTGSNGYVYEYNAQGILMNTNVLEHRGDNDIRLAINDNYLIVGINGFVVLVSLNDFENSDKNKNISLPGCGYEVVSVIAKGNNIYAGSNGFVYKMDSNGENMLRNNLPGRGNYPIQIAIDVSYLIVGTHGYVELVKLDDFKNTKKNIATSLPGCGYNPVSVLVTDRYIYAGCYGYAYQIDYNLGGVIRNNLPSRGHYNIEISITESYLAVGTYGYVVKVAIDDFKNINRNINTSLPDSGHENVKVITAGNAIFAGSNGHVYKLSTTSNGVLEHYGLPGFGNHEIRLSSGKDNLYVGINGYLIGYNKKIDMLDTFDHVVVLMLENRSFDNLMGYMYPGGVPSNAPLGKTFNGVSGKNLSNPVPTSVPGLQQPPDGSGKVFVSPVPKVKKPNHPDSFNYFTPYPDPGEEYSHINTQLFNTIKPPYNLPQDSVPRVPSKNQGFVTDYVENFLRNEEKKIPTYEEYKQIMECYSTEAVPVLSSLAKEFGVFDRWHCAVPSQTWCNRAFWNAGTSWGHVNNGLSKPTNNSTAWIKNSIGDTLFNQIHKSGNNSPLDWNIYSEKMVPSLTGIIHARALETFHGPIYKHFMNTKDFYSDCENGKLKSYSFLEPNFILNHNDMHPSSYDSTLFGKGHVGSVLLGEKLVSDVYNAIKSSNSVNGNNSQNTLLVITFDEHGGCYDHVSPIETTPPDLSKYTKWDDFDFKRSGLRVPTIMVSAHIAKNTVVNEAMEHTSFIRTVQEKWNKITPSKFPPLSNRSDYARKFTSVFTSDTPRPIEDWPTITEPSIPKEYMDIDYSSAPLNDLQFSILDGTAAIQNSRKRAEDAEIDISNIKTVGEAMAFFKSQQDIE